MSNIKDFIIEKKNEEKEKEYILLEDFCLYLIVHDYLKDLDEFIDDNIINTLDLNKKIAKYLIEQFDEIRSNKDFKGSNSKWYRTMRKLYLQLALFQKIDFLKMKKILEVIFNGN